MIILRSKFCKTKMPCTMYSSITVLSYLQIYSVDCSRENEWCIYAQLVHLYMCISPVSRRNWTQPGCDAVIKFQTSGQLKKGGKLRCKLQLPRMSIRRSEKTITRPIIIKIGMFQKDVLKTSKEGFQTRFDKVFSKRL